MKDTDKTVAVLEAATATQRAAYVARAEELYMAGLVRMRKQLADAGMDLNKVAPEPSSWNDGKKQYRMKKAARSRFMASFTEDGNDPRNPKYRGLGGPHKEYIVCERPDAEPRVRAAARQDANACWDSFLTKMAGKINHPITEAKFTGEIWDGCTVEVTVDPAVCGEFRQVWTTKCILNQSVYGKLFNQWPTRRVS